MPKNHKEENGYEHQQTSSQPLISLSKTDQGPTIMIDFARRL
jgi:hypothetical protein